MPNEKTPQLILRMGSHSEREYIIKTVQLFNGVMLAANLVEATPGASASLVVKLCGRSKLGFYLDPMTYAYGAYVDPATGSEREDLDWIKSEQRRKGKLVRDFKSSYRKLAERLGAPFDSAIERNSAVTPEDFKDDAVLAQACESVADYQVQRIRREFDDPEYAEFRQDLPTPAVVFAPYFYIGPFGWEAWLDLSLSLAKRTAGQRLPVGVHAVICADRSFLSEPTFVSRLVNEIPSTGVRGVWLWFSKFDEYRANVEELRTFRQLIERLAGLGLEVFNMHGGYFSLVLSKFGLKGVVQAVGYGEQKDVVPVIGQSTPTVRYYLPTLHKRLGVPDIQRCFRSLRITSIDTFLSKVCDCAICRGVIGKGLESFREFGDTQYSRPESKRAAQTPAAAKRCKFHFLLSRNREQASLREDSLQSILARWQEASATWVLQPSLRDEAAHLARWNEALLPVT